MSSKKLKDLVPEKGQEAEEKKEEEEEPVTGPYVRFKINNFDLMKIFKGDLRHKPKPLQISFKKFLFEENKF